MSRLPTPPTVTDHMIELPLTRLHYVKCGSGPPLIMVPATISRIEHWEGLAQFMGTKFTTYFFELPGHGLSTPFESKFSSELVAESIEDFIDELGYSKINLMGFSFGGILAIKTLLRLQERVERMALMAPCVTQRALHYSSTRKFILRHASNFLRTSYWQEKMIALLHNPMFEHSIVAMLKTMFRAEDNVPMNSSFHKMPRATLDVLVYQIGEALNLEHPPLKQKFSQPLHFAHSVNDPLIDFSTTYNFLDTYFCNINSLVTTFPYHQPPNHPTFEELQRDYADFLLNFAN